MALIPDAVFYLRMKSAEELAARVLASGRGFDYWESGMDLGLGNDYYDSFIAYQRLLLKEFDRMTGEYGFRVIDSNRPVRRVANELRRGISKVIDSDTGSLIKEVPVTEAQLKVKPPDVPTVKESAKAGSIPSLAGRGSRSSGTDFSL